MIGVCTVGILESGHMEGCCLGFNKPGFLANGVCRRCGRGSDCGAVWPGMVAWRVPSVNTIVVRTFRTPKFLSNDVCKGCRPRSDYGAA